MDSLCHGKNHGEHFMGISWENMDMFPRTLDGLFHDKSHWSGWELGVPPWLGKPPHGIDWYCGHSPWCMAFKKGGKHGIFIGVNANGKWLCSFNLAYEFAEVNGKWDANWLGFIGIKDDERKFSDRILGPFYGWETLCVAPWLSMARA